MFLRGDVLGRRITYRNIWAKQTGRKPVCGRKPQAEPVKRTDRKPVCRKLINRGAADYKLLKGWFL